ncbi:MAG: rhomboid family intramembrane serine protease [Cytophagales bacterium]|nr:rhomboid family intramembrane serine protease [Cytophagales bacterium]
MNQIKKAPTTCSLIFINVVVFSVNYFTINSFAEPAWTLHLLNQGAEFNPYTLDGQWYRIFSHMFMHGGIVHILFNMYALYSVGAQVEGEVGLKKFLWVYFLSGIAAALASLYWSLFTIGVGASGAIFGLFGFSLIINLLRSRKLGHSLAPIFINFAIFLGINLYFAKTFHADTAAHLGGLACGIVLGVYPTMRSEWLRQVKVEYALIPLFVFVYSVLPRYQVTYLNFFQYVLASEDSARQIFGKDASDEYYLAALKKSDARWDTALQLLNNHAYLPAALHSDTFKLRQYIKLRKQESAFRIKMIEHESFIYIDSIEIAEDSMRHFYKLDYPLTMTRPPKEEQSSAEEEKPRLESIRVLYNEDWEEILEPPFTFYRVGTRDSLGRWQGRVMDFYLNGDVQMKGSYADDSHEGIFIFYSNHKTYTSAGRYSDDRPIGKWETFHNNGRLESEVYYTDRYFLKNRWDSTGNQLVKEGYGKIIEHHASGAVSEEGEYHDGYKEGYWYGRHANRDMYYEENYFHNRLMNGRSRNLEGDTFVYDESSLFPLPHGGWPTLMGYIQSTVKQVDLAAVGTVRLSFRVTEKGNLTAFKVIGSVSREADEKAKQILKEGPRWIPAKVHGHKEVNGFGYAEVVF